MTTIVIGANFGDEGKGLMTDFFARKGMTKEVVRFNGGAQAGHTVTTDSTRHVFSSFSSGTLAGLHTRLTADVVLNPYAALREAETLPNVKLRVSPLSPLTTPFEVQLNQAVEEKRGPLRHGSCGLGINETVERHQGELDAGFHPISIYMFPDPRAVSKAEMIKRQNVIRARLDWIAYSWVPRRADKLGVSPEVIKEILDNAPKTIENFITLMAQAVMLFDCSSPSLDNSNPLYEGAQGLALDQTLGTFPYVTRSNTGLWNALSDLRFFNLKTPKMVNAVYATRTYLTRHGAGPFPHEMHADDVLCGGSVHDETNFPNPWQGTLRFAPLNIPELARRIYADIGRCQPFELSIRPCIALTCVDQAEDVLVIARDGEAPTKIKAVYIADLLDYYALPVRYMSHGAKASDVEELPNKVK